MEINQIAENFFKNKQNQKEFIEQMEFIEQQTTPDYLTIDLEQQEEQNEFIKIIIKIKLEKLEMFKDFAEVLGNQKCVQFAFYISPIFPRQTRLICLTKMLYYPINDGRDILKEVYSKPFGFDSKIQDVIEKIPEFVYNLLKNSNNSEYFQSLGQWYLGRNYFMQEIKQYQGLNFYPCVQLKLHIFSQFNVRVIGISQTHFLLFDLPNKNTMVHTLIFVSDLQALVQIKRNLSKNDRIQLLWKNYKTQQQISQSFQIEKPKEFIKLILKRVHNFSNLVMNTNVFINFKGYSDQQQDQFQQCVKQIQELEIEIKSKFNLQNVQNLMRLYNIIIEQYSQHDSYIQDVYFSKLQQLLRRKDVQVLLQISQNQQIQKSVKTLSVPNGLGEI